jgi:hypothetical protein
MIASSTCSRSLRKSANIFVMSIFEVYCTSRLALWWALLSPLGHRMDKKESPWWFPRRAGI